MKHLNDITIMEFTAGNLSHDDKQSLERHISDCAQCRARVLEFQSQWAGLGRWQEDTAVKDMSFAIHQRISGRVLQPKKELRVFLHRFVFKAAAIILFGAMLGFLSGKYGASGHSVDNSVTGVLEYMQSLSLGYSSELTWAAMETGFEQGSDK